MSKRKHSQPGIFGYIWRELLFAHYFELESQQAPHDLADALDSLDYENKDGVWKERQSTTVNMHPNNKGFDFKIARKRKHPGDLIYLTTARASGTAIVDGGTGKTILRGAVTFGRLFHGVLIAYLLYLMFSAPSLISQLLTTTHIGADLLVPPFIWLLVGSLLFFYWRRIYTDRNQLAQYLEAQIKQSDISTSQQRLSANEGADVIAYRARQTQQEQRH